MEKKKKAKTKKIRVTINGKARYFDLDCVKDTIRAIYEFEESALASIPKNPTDERYDVLVINEKVEHWRAMYYFTELLEGIFKEFEEFEKKNKKG